MWKSKYKMTSDFTLYKACLAVWDYAFIAVGAFLYLSLYKLVVIHNLSIYHLCVLGAFPNFIV